uniref:acyl carrier protein n=1 Tax=Saccharothrix sp. NRRL B-16314 TaxID=1463825 RepID=UPI001E4D0A2D
MPIATALRHFDTAVTAPAAHYCAATLTTTGLDRTTTPPILHRLLPATTSTTTTVHNGLREQLATLPEHQHRHHVQQRVLTAVATVLGHTDTTTIHPTNTFKTLGFDSLTAI